jgi:hypothetical protein
LRQSSLAFQTGEEGMVLRRSIVRFVVLGVTLLAGAPALPTDLPEGMISVKYRMEIDGLPMQKGESFCHLRKECLLGFDFDQVQVTLKLGTRASVDSLAISCRRLDEHCTLVDTLPASQFRQAGLNNFDVLAWKGGMTFGAGITRRIGSLVFQVRQPKRTSSSPRRI